MEFTCTDKITNTTFIYFHDVKINGFGKKNKSWKG